VRCVLDRELNLCKCGGRPRYRYSVPLHWIECRNKKCANRTRYYADQDEPFDPKAQALAIAEWNKQEQK